MEDHQGYELDIDLSINYTAECKTIPIILGRDLHGNGYKSPGLVFDLRKSNSLVSRSGVSILQQLEGK